MAQEQNEAQQLVGRVLANTYRLEQLLTSGGMGAIYRARHLRTGGTCAVKILHSRSAQNVELYERFKDEARIISALRHPNIVTVMDLDIDAAGPGGAASASGLTFIVMELLEGEDLQDRLERLGKIELHDALQIARQVGSALHAAHQKGVIHRDLKPRNIFLARQEINGQVVETAKVIDFGVSKIPRPADRATRDLLVLGTPRYMAPEGALGQNSQIDGRSDEWSVAVILYRMLSGKLPFDQENVIDLFKQVVNDDPTPIEQLVPNLPKHVVAAIKRALNKKKEDRFPTMVEFLAALDPPQKKKKKKPARPAGATQVDWRRSLLFAGVGALLTGLLLIPILKRASSSRRHGMQSSELLKQADQALLEERWGDAGELAERVLALPAQKDTVYAAAQITKTRAENGVKAQQVYQRLQAAVQNRDYDTALAINRELPPNLGFRITVKEQTDLLLPLVIGTHLQKAEAARSAGQCSEVVARLQKVLKLDPDNESALQARWRHCAPLADATPPGPWRLAGYPPVRIEDGSGPELPGDYPGGRTSRADIDRFLREAESAQQRGHLWSAITLAHVAAGTASRRSLAWTIVGVSACGLKNTKLISLAIEHLDGPSREFVKTGCAQAGFPIRY